jgi:hypothetical protein
MKVLIYTETADVVTRIQVPRGRWYLLPSINTLVYWSVDYRYFRCIEPSLTGVPIVQVGEWPITEEHLYSKIITAMNKNAGDKRVASDKIIKALESMKGTTALTNKYEMGTVLEAKFTVSPVPETSIRAARTELFKITGGNCYLNNHFNPTKEQRKKGR